MFWGKWIINGILLSLVLFFGIRTYRIWTKPIQVPPLVKMTGRGKKTKHIGISKRDQNRTRSNSDYLLIVEKNLFSPERKGPERETNGEDVIVKEEKPPSNLRLYGIVLTEKYRKALLTNPDRKKNKNRFVWATEGDSLGEYKLLEILNDKVLLKRNGKRYEVSLYEGKKRREVAPTKSSRPSKPSTVVLKEKKVHIPTPWPARKSVTETGKYRIINTPFGKIRRKK